MARNTVQNAAVGLPEVEKATVGPSQDTILKAADGDTMAFCGTDRRAEAA